MNRTASASIAPDRFALDSFGDLLRYWRGKRGYSQLDLAARR